MAKQTVLPLLPPEEILVGERFRTEMGDIEGLATDILERGLIQPISINRSNKLMAGGRRLAAFKLAQSKEPQNKHVKDGIPVIVWHDTSEVTLREVEMRENYYRKGMTWVEEVNLIAAIHAMHKVKDPTTTYGDTGKKLGGLSKSIVALKLEMHQALQAFPDLAKAANLDTARRTFKSLLEEAVVSEGMKNARQELAGVHNNQATRPEGVSPNDNDETVDWNSVFLHAADSAYSVGDTLQLLPKVRPGSFNFAEVDPPYGIGLTEQKPDSESLDKYNEIERSNYPDFLAAIASATFRALAPDSWCIFWFGPEWYHEVTEALATAGFAYDPIPALWTKPESGGQSNAPDVNLARGYEPFIIARKGSPVLRKRGRLNNFAFKPVSPTTKIHPTERPIELMKEIFETFVYPKSRVLIPFLGSGVSIIAAIENGAIFTAGWDLEESFKNRFLARVAVRWPRHQEAAE